MYLLREIFITSLLKFLYIDKIDFDRHVSTKRLSNSEEMRLILKTIIDNFLIIFRHNAKDIKYHKKLEYLVRSSPNFYTKCKTYCNKYNMYEYLQCFL